MFAGSALVTPRRSRRRARERRGLEYRKPGSSPKPSSSGFARSGLSVTRVGITVGSHPSPGCWQCHWRVCGQMAATGLCQEENLHSALAGRGFSTRLPR